MMQSLSGCAQASEPANRPAGPVSDAADILPPEIEASLDRRLRDYFDHNRTALVVASVDSLDDQRIETVSLGLAKEWDIGDGKNMRGLLILVAPNERQVRIEVSCGLESVITDVAAGRIIRDDMVPRFKEGDLAQGTLAGVDALIERLDAGANPAPASEQCKELMRKAA